MERPIARNVTAKGHEVSCLMIIMVQSRQLYVELRRDAQAHILSTLLAVGEGPMGETLPLPKLVVE